MFCFQTTLILGTQGVASNVFYVSVYIKSKQKLNYFLLAYCMAKILIKKKKLLLKILISMVHSQLMVLQCTVSHRAGCQKWVDHVILVVSEVTEQPVETCLCL